MKDASTALRISYYNKLKGLVVNEKEIPVYANEVNDTYEPTYTRLSPPPFYIVISNQTLTPDWLRQKWRNRYSIQVDVYTVYPVSEGSFLFTEEIANAVYERILPSLNYDIDVPGFKCISSDIDLSRNQVESVKDKNIFRKITIFTHHIEQI